MDPVAVITARIATDLEQLAELATSQGTFDAVQTLLDAAREQCRSRTEEAEAARLALEAKLAQDLLRVQSKMGTEGSGIALRVRDRDSGDEVSRATRCGAPNLGCDSAAAGEDDRPAMGGGPELAGEVLWTARNEAGACGVWRVDD